MIIGGASFLGGRGSVLNAITGALIIAVMRNGFNLLGIDPNWQYIATGVVIVVAVELDVVRGQPRVAVPQHAGGGCVMSESTPVLEVRDATKRFGAVTALDDVSLHCATRRGPGTARRQRRRQVDADQGDQRCPSSRLGHGSRSTGSTSRTPTPPAPEAAGSRPSTKTWRCSTIWHQLRTSSQDVNWPAPSWLPRPCRFLRGEAMSERTRELVDRLQITLPDFDAPVALMSGGQRQAVAVARAVAFSSKLVILDEPTAALGLRESGRVLDLIRRLKTDGVAVILISHSMDHVTGGRRPGGRAPPRSDRRRARPQPRQPRTARGVDRRRRGTHRN